MRAYLLDIAERFQRLARDGVEGRYNHEFFGDLDDHQVSRKLRARLQNLTRAFYGTLVTKGVDRKIEWEDGEKFPFYDTGGIEWIWDKANMPIYMVLFMAHSTEIPEPETVSEEDLRYELEELAATNQKTEFPGLPSSNLAFQLFRMQVRPWEDIAKLYVERAIGSARYFVEDLFLFIIGADDQTATAVLTLSNQFFEDKEAALKYKLKEILQPYTEAFPAAFTKRGGRGFTRELLETAFNDVESVCAIVRMNKERIKELASESECVQLKSQNLQREVNMLRSGLKMCQRFRLHEKAGPSI
ncbi:hypothetical protein F4802DRAFT_595490 [Xylaria palmicola]|nr:hypothetical protein F4802DRAFT_595490 [Xylaria palmicola]